MDFWRIWNWVERFQLPISIVGMIVPTGALTWIVGELDKLSYSERWLIFCFAWLFVSIGTYWAIATASRLSRHFARRKKQDWIRNFLDQYNHANNKRITLGHAAEIWAGTNIPRLFNPYLRRLKTAAATGKMGFAPKQQDYSADDLVEVPQLRDWLIEIGELDG